MKGMALHKVMKKRFPMMFSQLHAQWPLPYIKGSVATLRAMPTFTRSILFLHENLYIPFMHSYMRVKHSVCSDADRLTVKNCDDTIMYTVKPLNNGNMGTGAGLCLF